jgi:DNA-binding transcriptional LysR family regulator|tara:strand:- start:2371 stop:3249 length:879 start_codon:yes stop_codon:yes gene_type:complete
MELRHLRSFCTAARVQGISKAANQLDIGQPTVSMHIKKLEEELGVILFERIKRPIQLTPVGNTLAQMISPMIDNLDNLITEDVIAGWETPVTLGAPHTVIPHLLLESVGLFRKTYPNTPLHIRSGHRREVLQMVRNREIDLGIIPGRDHSFDLDFRNLSPYETVLITPLGHPLLSKPVKSFAEIASYPLILMEQSTFTRSLLESEFRNNGLGYEIVMELQNMDYIKRYVALGMGISVGPRLGLRKEDSTDLSVIDLDHLIPPDQVGCVTLAGRPLSKSVLNFRDILERMFHK